MKKLSAFIIIALILASSRLSAFTLFQCQNCPVGTYSEGSNKLGQQSCLECPAGHYCINGIKNQCPTIHAKFRKNILLPYECKTLNYNTANQFLMSPGYITTNLGVISIPSGNNVYLQCDPMTGYITIKYKPITSIDDSKTKVIELDIETNLLTDGITASQDETYKCP